MKQLRKQIFTPTDLNDNLLHRLRRNDNTLIRLIFCSRNLGSQGAIKVAQALRTNSHLTALDLSSNRIDSRAAYSIASLLAHQTSMANTYGNRGGGGGIKNLILGENDFRDEGVKAMAYALENNSILESLWMDDNCIGASGLATLADSLTRNYKLERLHLKHNSFQSLLPLIQCTFDKQSLNSVADSNHTLKYVFLNCGYSYECEELEGVLKINRMGRHAARRTKIALFLEEDMGKLFQLDINTKLLPHIMGIIGMNGSLSAMFCVLQNLPSESLFYHHEIRESNSDVEHL